MTLKATWDSFVANMRFREVLAIIADALTAVAIFLPWVFGFSPPSGPNYAVTLAAAPDLIDLVLHCGYPVLLGIPVALLLGLLFVLLPQTVGRRGKLLLIGSALAISVVSFMIFVVQFSSAYALMWDGTSVSSSTIYAHGYRVIAAAEAFYVLAFLATAMSD